MTIEQILEAIENMKVLELNELVKAAEEKFRCICFSSSYDGWCSCWWSC